MEKYTHRVKNKIIDKGDHYEMILCDKKGNEKGRALFSKKHIKDIKKSKWCISSRYVVATRKYQYIRLHHLILGKPPKGLVTDHINRNPLDNRDENLRFVTPSQNQFNTKIRKDNSSGIKGVHFDKRIKKWIAQIMVNGNKKFIKCKSKNEAIKSRKYLESFIIKQSRMIYEQDEETTPVTPDDENTGGDEGAATPSEGQPLPTEEQPVPSL